MKKTTATLLITILTIVMLSSCTEKPVNPKDAESANIQNNYFDNINEKQPNNKSITPPKT